MDNESVEQSGQDKGLPVEGPRGCGEFEVGPTMDLLNFVFRHPDPPEIGTDYGHAYRHANRDNMRIIKVGRQVVAHAGMRYMELRCPRGDLRMGCIGGVCSHPDYRGRGYASAVMRDCVSKMHEDGIHVGLLGTGIPDFYRRMGWENAGLRHRYAVDCGNVELLPEPRLTRESGPEVDELPSLC